MSDNRKFLTKEQAIDFVGGKRDSIHCFVGNGGMVIGADWAWSEFENLLEKSDTIEEAGENATKMGHPLCVWDGGRPRFFEAAVK